MLPGLSELCVAHSSISESQEEELLSTLEILASRKVHFLNCIFTRGIPSMILSNVETAFISHLTFRSCSLSDSALGLLSIVLESNESNIVHLDLLGNSFTNNGITRLTSALENNWSLMRLWIEFDNFSSGHELMFSVAMTRFFAETFASKLMNLNPNSPQVLIDFETISRLIAGGFAALNEVLYTTYNMRDSGSYVKRLAHQIYKDEEFRDFWNRYNNI